MDGAYCWTSDAYEQQLTVVAPKTVHQFDSFEFQPRQLLA